MKKYLSILSALLLGSCSEAPIEELPAIPEGPAASGVVFTVEAAGYTTDNPDSRAVDSGYETTFVAGDRIGLFCYDAEGGLLGDNGILTYDGRIWSGEIDPAGAARLIAYYPYEEQFAGGIRQTSDFFSFGWITDQSTPEKYTAADQMVCETEYDGVSPSIALHMQRQRSMIEFRIASDAVLAEATTTVNNYTCTYKPYRVEAGVYRILTPERSSGIRITATILDGNIEKTYAINQATLTLGKYNTYRINYTATTKISLDGTRSLADMLTEQFGEGYDPASITALQLSGPLTAADWSTLKELTGLATADLKGVTAPEIPAQQFQNFSALTTVVLPERLETIGSWAFSGSSIRKIELPETLTTIGDRAFRGVATLATVVIPASVREIRTAAFENMTALTSVTFEEGSQLSAIGDWAFAGDTRLTTFSIPAGVTQIDSYAFGGCTSLYTVTCSASTPPSTNGATNLFSSTGVRSVLVPEQAADLYRTAAYWSDLALVPIPDGSRIRLSAADAASPYTATNDGSGLAALFDGDPATYWHTWWSQSTTGDPTYGRYIDIALPQSVTEIALLYQVRATNANVAPNAFVIGVGSDGTNWTPLGAPVDATDTGAVIPSAAAAWGRIPWLTHTEGFDRLRIGITTAGGNALTQGPDTNSTALAELTIFTR